MRQWGNLLSALFQVSVQTFRRRRLIDLEAVRVHGLAQTLRAELLRFVVLRTVCSSQTFRKGDYVMANCGEMKKGDLFVCKSCGLELQVSKACTCGSGAASCSVPLQCCGKDMVKK
jgi:hypothetical protein